VTLKGDRIAEEFQELVENYVRHRYGSGGSKQRDQLKVIPIKAVS
jgi:hypothetical protein